MQAALISALTAAVITLLIEYFAKPALEARKDRLIGASRARRDMVVALGSFGHLTERLMTAVGNDDWTTAVSLFKTIDEKAVRVSERHVEAKHALSIHASYIASEAIRILQMDIAIMERSLPSARNESDDPEAANETDVDLISRASEVGKAAHCIRAVYGPSRQGKLFSTQGLGYAERLLSQINKNH